MSRLITQRLAAPSARFWDLALRRWRVRFPSASAELTAGVVSHGRHILHHDVEMKLLMPAGDSRFGLA
jgi:hypothetical protein